MKHLLIPNMKSLLLICVFNAFSSLDFTSSSFREPDYTSWVSLDKQLIKFVVFKRPFVNFFLDIVRSSAVRVTFVGVTVV